jgi:tRNA (mo5U34)-methyltransferase
VNDPATSPPGAALREQVEQIRWFHSIRLGDDLVTPGKEGDTAAKLEWVQLPHSLAGKSVLDVGTWDGFFAFEAERRGADRVLATDHHAWNSPEFGKAGFDCARTALGSSVEDRDLDVLDHTPDAIGTWDVVLFLGVLYHLRHPLLALERLRSVTRELLILETHVELLPSRRPMAAFYPADELSGDASNWWGPNVAAVLALLRAAGFSEVELVYPRSRGRTAARAVAMAGRGVADRLRGRPYFPRATTARAAFHARP